MFLFGIVFAGVAESEFERQPKLTPKKPRIKNVGPVPNPEFIILNWYIFW